MSRHEVNQRLSAISTAWTVLRLAHQGAGAEAAAAQQQLLEHYGGAVRRYLHRAVDDPHMADDLFQEFALALVRGEFRRADPQHGRFRHYVKSALVHLIGKHRKRRQKAVPTLSPRGPELAGIVAAPADPKAEFDEEWRQELLARVWNALAKSQPTFHAVLRFRADHPKMRSPDMAAELGRRLGKPVTPDGLRQTLRRARERFADLLLDEIAGSLEAPALDQVEEELAELNLLEYCRPALARRGHRRALEEQPSRDEEALGDREDDRRLFLWAAEQVRGGFEEATWQAFWQTAVEGKTPRVTAESLGMTLGAVYTAKSRVLDRLRKAIQGVQDGEGPPKGGG